MAAWQGVDTENCTHWFMSTMPRIKAGGPTAHPIFHPVHENVLPEDDTVTVRSAMPGTVAMRAHSRPSYTMCSYTSSLTTTTAGKSASTAAMSRSSSGERILPVGLCGEFNNNTRVRGVKAARSSAMSSRHSGVIGGGVRG